LGMTGISSEYMSKNMLRMAVLGLCCVLLGLAGCEPEQTTSPILPGETAVFIITFNPSPVYEGYSERYRFMVLIDEVNGVGARISSIKVEYIDDTGNVLETDNYDESEVIRTFGTSRIEAYGRLMTNVVVADCSSCARESWLVRAEDDQGQHVEYSGSVELISRL
jgi:hypothetical protein